MMSFDELPLNTPALFKHRDSTYSWISEYKKLTYSENKKAVLLAKGNCTAAGGYTCWEGVDHFNSKFELFDTL